MLEVHGATVASPRDHVARLAAAWRVSPFALPVLDDAGTFDVAGGTITRVTQTIDGLPVWGGELRVFVKTGGELHAIIYNPSHNDQIVIKPRERIGQLIFEQVHPIEWVKVEELPPSKRGEAGWGSTGR